MNIQDIKILIFPDIHGRTFWKDAVEKYGASAARDMFKTSDLLGDYKFLKKNLFLNVLEKN